jgi:adenylate kinase
MTGSRDSSEKPADAGSNAEYPLKLPPGAPLQLQRCKDFRRVIVVTGTPGVGKSQFSRLLAKRIGGIHMDIGKAALTWGFTLGTDIVRSSKIADLRRISNWIRKRLSESDEDVVVEGHYASAVVSKRFVTLVIVLRSDPDELIKRLRKRRFPRRKVYENVAAEVLDLCLIDAIRSYGRKKICEIDTTRRTLKSILTEALGLINGTISPSFGNVDWLGRLEERGKLDELIKYDWAR